MLENLALRQQLVVFKARNPRPGLSAPDKLFWVLARRFWTGWRKALVVVTPETVVRWHRVGFRLYWTWLSRHKARLGRKRISKEVRELIFQMVAENPTWGAPRIHGELQMLGFEISERTVSRWVRRAPRKPEPAQRWRAFLRNHREVIAAMDFFRVPTFTFSVLRCGLAWYRRCRCRCLRMTLRSPRPVIDRRLPQWCCGRLRVPSPVPVRTVVWRLWQAAPLGSPSALTGISGD